MRHRISKDVDLFVPDPQYLGYLDPGLNETVEALTPKRTRFEFRDAILERLASGDKILRTTFKELETLDYRPTYDHCVKVLRDALKRSR